jgi:hypothetical protein
MPVSSDGELEEEVSLDKIVTDEDKAKAGELKAQANKAFAGESLRVTLHATDS